MSSRPAEDDVRGLFADGVTAVSEVAARLTDDEWGRAACGSWSGTEVARHLLGVSRWYHEWLDRAMAGIADPPFAETELGRRNDEVLATLSGLDGPAAIDAFTTSAADYLDRLPPHWDTPFGFPYGTVTAGLHCGVAAGEWNLHAWDLSTLAPPAHQPAHADRLFVAMGRCFAAAEGGAKGIAIGAILPVAARRDPWSSLLRRSGRSG